MDKIKSARNMISSWRDEDNLIIDPAEMEELALKYFTKFFGFAGHVQSSNMINIIATLVIDSMNAILTSMPSTKEIRVVIFNLIKESAPSPDGFGGVFLSNLLEYHLIWCLQCNLEIL